MELLIVILLVLGLVLFVLAALSLPAGRINLTAAGLACWILTVLMQAWPG